MNLKSRVRTSAAMAVLALTTLICEPSAARANTLVNVAIPTTATATNPCNGEPVVLSGAMHVLVSQTTDSSGGVRLLLSINLQGMKGTGASGAMYVLSDSGTLQITVNQGAAQVTEPVNLHLISQGASPNFVAHQLLHVTINAAGTVTTALENLNANCRG